MFDHEFKDEPELRNRLGTVWLASLFDSLHAEVKQLEKYRDEANQRRLVHMSRYCDQAQYFFDSIKGIMGLYSKSEQVFIVYLRNQWVHSFLSGRHADQVTIKFVEGGELKTERISRHDYDDMVRPYFEEAPLDQTLKAMTNRFRDTRLEYWVILSEIQKVHHIVYEAMLNGREFQFDSIPV